ncbi:monooxygenase [Mycolicibacterium duvalii]|uniref:Monooxygenase n=1 Tax=Mycolicibacterium duvalii TaxID=39688 RepID=A0A7I7JYM3_9MYCO|nr:NAD(P)/FAD-dependent oxidoreductase [Mycolicibacterium duvalii]MCV7369558.1 NAD(P)/FAD-dependent oxidoreductase [Mycolicibacterium duvalii]PEG42184.1 monooxygenase [Mycolicibacterium duvalii]BBX16281.1 monooxygenase [Mycolicibacterium duvalii]
MSFDPEAVNAKYRAERDRRLVPSRAALRDLFHDERVARYLADPFAAPVQREPITDDPDVVILGAGIAGLLAGVQLRKAGVERIRIIDRAGGIGGTWYWNRYPGVMCDIESYQYLPLLEELDYIPTRRYAYGEEIRHHLQAIAERFDLSRDALFHTGIQRAEWNDATARWAIHTDRGDVIRSRYYVVAAGILNLLKLPDIPGMDGFRGAAFHTARWDYGYTGGAPGQPMAKLGDRTVALVGTGASGLQALSPLAQAARHVYVFQRTPSAIGVRDNRPTDPEFRRSVEPGWQKRRMDNFQSIMLGRPVDTDLTDDGWTKHYAAVQNPPRIEGADLAEFIRNAERIDFEIMEQHRQRIDQLVADPQTAEQLKPYYRYLCKRPCFHDEYFDAYNRPNVTLVNCPTGIERITEHGLVVNGHTYEVDCIIYGTGFEAEVTPLPRRAGHEIVGRNGTTLAAKWAEGRSGTLFGLMSHGFPNMFVMPGPGQQSVVTVNYTQLALLGAEFVGATVALLDKQGAQGFDVSARAEADWVAQIISTHVDASGVMSACTPSRLNNEGDPGAIQARDTNFGRGFGDYFAYRDLLENWLAAGDLAGLDLL